MSESLHDESSKWQNIVFDIATKESYKAAARQCGISVNRVKEIVVLLKQRRMKAADIAKEERLPVVQRKLALTSLSTRSRNALAAAGYKTCGDVADISSKELLNLPNFGLAALRELRAYLRREG